MTLLVASIEVDTLEEARRSIDAAFASGAEAVELRIDAVEGDPRALATFVKQHPRRKWILTCRTCDEGGSFRGDTRERVARLLAAARGTGAWVDFEWADWKRSDNIRQKVRLATDGEAGRLILSAHDFSGRPADLRATVDAILAVDGVATAKVAYHAAGICDTFDALDLMHSHGRCVVAIAMGEDGVWTRVLAKKFGAFATYASGEGGAETAPGQLALRQMVRDYRFGDIGPTTRVYGVLGDPVGHSLSPLLFNRWFAGAGIDAVYLPMRVRGGGESLRRFLDGCRRRPWLDIGGFSVTLPHKVDALVWAQRGADATARWIGATNTLVFADDVRAHNTDCHAAITAITEALGCEPSHLAGRTVDILGAGGAAQAVCYGLYEQGCVPTVYARTPSKAAPLAEAFGCTLRDWNDRVERTGEIVINCTSIGMAPRSAERPLPPESFGGCMLAFDMVYHPHSTRFLADAAAAGATCVPGLEMFVRQAAAQFELWTGQRPDQTAARTWLATALPPTTDRGEG